MLSKLSKLSSLGVLSLVLFSGCSEGSETEFYQEGIAHHEDSSVSDNTIEPDSEDRLPEDDKYFEKKEYFDFGKNEPQNKQYLFQKESSPNMSDRELLNSQMNYCELQKNVALEAVQYKLAGVSRETTLQTVEGRVEKFTPLWDDVTRVIMFAYAAPNTVDKELRGKIGNPSNVYQSLHPDDVANKVFIMCMQDYGHFTDYKLD